MFQESGLSDTLFLAHLSVIRVQHWCFIHYCFLFFSLQSLDREKSCKKTLILYQCTSRHTSPYKTQQSKYRVTSANKYKTKAQEAYGQAVSHFNCRYNSDWFCQGKATDEKYQLLIFMSYYLNLHQGAGALLKMSNEKMVMLYSSVLPSVGIQSFGLGAASFPCQCPKRLSLLPSALQSFDRRMGREPISNHSELKQT